MAVLGRRYVLTRLKHVLKVQIAKLLWIRAPLRLYVRQCGNVSIIVLACSYYRGWVVVPAPRESFLVKKRPAYVGAVHVEHLGDHLLLLSTAAGIVVMMDSTGRGESNMAEVCPAECRRIVVFVLRKLAGASVDLLSDLDALIVCQVGIGGEEIVLTAGAHVLLAR